MDGGLLGRRNTCVTVGGAFLSAPHGSTVLDGGTRVRLPGIGTFRIGGLLPALPGRVVTRAAGALPPGLLDCEAGRYAEVRAR